MTAAVSVCGRWLQPFTIGSLISLELEGMLHCPTLFADFTPLVNKDQSTYELQVSFAFVHDDKHRCY